jgi:hypothetical protein
VIGTPGFLGTPHVRPSGTGRAGAGSSPGGACVVALARQCRQASRQARVVSQNTSMGRWAKSTEDREFAALGNAAGLVIGQSPPTAGISIGPSRLASG